jgi:hypothetical protein
VYGRFATLFRQQSPIDGGINNADRVALMYCCMYLDGPSFAAAMEAFGYSPQAFDKPAYATGQLPMHVSEAAAASALGLWRAAGSCGFVVIVGAAVTDGLEALAPVAAAGLLRLVDPRNRAYNAQDPSRDDTVYVECYCDGGGDISGAVLQRIPSGAQIDVISFVDCLYTDDQARVASECRDALLLAALDLTVPTTIAFWWSGQVAVRATLSGFLLADACTSLTHGRSQRPAVIASVSSSSWWGV